jgi:hypothetical protein
LCVGAAYSRRATLAGSNRVADSAEPALLLAPCGEKELIAEPVPTPVNRVANDDPHCIEIQRSPF